MYCNKSLREYLDELAAKRPAPGGGSAAALVGALGCALLSMVCNYTLAKERYKDVEKEIKKILKQTETLRKRFLSLVSLDAAAYLKVFNSRNNSPGIYQRNLINATKVPLEVYSLSAAAYRLCPFLIKKANKHLISDVYVARELLKSCFKSSQFNVIINFPQIKDKKFISQAKRIIQNNK
jgi:formiminotetrahydrofolate cyclodeaminase